MKDKEIFFSPDPNNVTDICSKCFKRFSMASMDYDDNFQNPICKKCNQKS